MSSLMKYSTFVRKVQKCWKEEHTEMPFLCTISIRVCGRLRSQQGKSKEARENYNYLAEKFRNQVSRLIDGRNTVGSYLVHSRNRDTYSSRKESNIYRAELLSKILQQAIYAERLAEEAKKVARYNKRRG